MEDSYFLVSKPITRYSEQSSVELAYKDRYTLEQN
jgi:hypothetical protein